MLTATCLMPDTGRYWKVKKNNNLFVYLKIYLGFVDFLLHNLMFLLLCNKDSDEEEEEAMSTPASSEEESD